MYNRVTSFLKKVGKRKLFFVLIAILIASAVKVYASSDGSESGSAHGFVDSLIWIGVILLLAKLSSLVEKIGQPSVLGELLVGVIIGNLALLHFGLFEGLRHDAFIPFLAELGVIILLFQVGLESNIQQMRKVGLRAFLVATIGVVAPFVLGTYVVGPWLMPDLSSNGDLFLGAALTATSVGITARVFKDLNKLSMPEAQIVLGAAVIDDVMGLVILAVVSAIATVGAVTIGGVAAIVLKAIAFLAASIVVGQIAAPRLGRFLSKVHTGIGMKFTLAVVFALGFAYVAGKIGLAPIVGAFAAGLVLDPVHFTAFKKPRHAEELEEGMEGIGGEHRERLVQIADRQSEKHIEDLIEPLAHFLVPIFFVWTGYNVRLETLFDTKILGLALAVTLVAFAGKYISGFVAGDVNKTLVGFGMVPRGEVGLIFAAIGKSLGVISDEIYSVIVIMVIFTTLLTPPILTTLLKKQDLRTIKP